MPSSEQTLGQCSGGRGSCTHLSMSEPPPLLPGGSVACERERISAALDRPPLVRASCRPPPPPLPLSPSESVSSPSLRSTCNLWVNVSVPGRMGIAGGKRALNASPCSHCPNKGGRLYPASCNLQIPSPTDASDSPSSKSYSHQALWSQE